jgi:phosphopentomutase
MGTIPVDANFTLIQSVSGEIENTLLREGFQVRRFPENGDILIVDDAVVIADNLEADAGQNINLTVALEEISFDKAVHIGQIVRGIVKVARVIVFGGPRLTLKKILENVERRDTQIGVNSPALGVYDENLQVRHLGYGVDPHRQLASILAHANKRVSLIGKMADLITCPNAYRKAVVPTRDVMSEIVTGLRDDSFDFLAATVQETDLAGHEGNPHRFAEVLLQVDKEVEVLISLFEKDDLLIITADHGNDPTFKSGTHTREQVPVLLYQPEHPPVSFKDRLSLADMAVTVSALFDIPPPQDGTAITTTFISH